MSAASEAFSLTEAIEEGRFDPYLHRIHGAIHQRQRTPEYQATLIAGHEFVPDGSTDSHG